MKLIKLKITPLSSFGTFPKGDMIFGHFANYLFTHSELDSESILLKKYLEDKSPKIIFSDFLPDGYLPKPTLPLNCFGENIDKKEFSKKNWIKIENLQNGKLSSYDSVEFFREKSVTRNSINRLTFTTDDSGPFTPYSTKEIEFLYQPVVYIMYDEKSFDEDRVIEILNQIGCSGFGKKSSIGKGQFEVEIDKSFKGFKTHSQLDLESNYYLTISPTLLNEEQNIKNAYYNLFNRFGKYHSSNTPFKKPLLMCDSGAVVKLQENKEYIGRAINNGVNNPSFVQGYSILVPFDLDCKGVTK
jgi:CRISPR-associated protein Csm4